MARILLAEDDDGMRAFLARALERAGHDVVAVPDGLAGLAMKGEQAFNLLVADIVMPGLDGIKLSRRAHKVNADLRVMFLTGFAAVAMDAKRSLGDAKVLSKPFQLCDLVDHVDRVLAA